GGRRGGGGGRCWGWTWGLGNGERGMDARRQSRAACRTLAAGGADATL
ncbi:MAG: hypothetical protein AVDCRST_MAG68-1553, partial [uncultured Gemmatimonadetes bacterium]